MTKEMKLHVLVNKVLKRNNWPLRNNFLGQTKIVLVYKMYTHLVSPDCSEKTKPTAANGE